MDGGEGAVSLTRDRHGVAAFDRLAGTDGDLSQVRNGDLHTVPLNGDGPHPCHRAGEGNPTRQRRQHAGAGRRRHVHPPVPPIHALRGIGPGDRTLDGEKQAHSEYGPHVTPPLPCCRRSDPGENGPCRRTYRHHGQEGRGSKRRRRRQH